MSACLETALQVARPMNTGFSRRFACTTSNESHTAGQVANRVPGVEEHGLERVPERRERLLTPLLKCARCNCFQLGLCLCAGSFRVGFKNFGNVVGSGTAKCVRFGYGWALWAGFDGELCAG